MPLQIVHYDDPILRKKGEKIKTFDRAVARLAAEMVETMHVAGGIGLAAQQVGRALQLCVVDLRAAQADFSWRLDGAQPPMELFMPMIIVNPKITPGPPPEDIAEEGCLSFPNIRGDVARPEAITVEFQDEQGTPHLLHCDGLFARCIQHEADHLNGVLFIDRMDKKSLAKLEPAIRELKKQTRAAAKA
ncbi:MAG TPA: peptide deformylase [Opitutaceae bacterium]|jgi:peptide deformylase|nr:peptide deformylase [Opitutaceae bacterium]